MPLGRAPFGPKIHIQTMDTTKRSTTSTASEEEEDVINFDIDRTDALIETEAAAPPLSPMSLTSIPASPTGHASGDVLKIVAKVLRGIEGVTSKNTERLRFLDPELKSTQSRIEILEILCQSNEDKINDLTGDIATVQIRLNKQAIPSREAGGKNFYEKEVITNNYIRSSMLREISKSQSEKSSKETNTKLIIEKQFGGGRDKTFKNTGYDGMKNYDNDFPSKFQSHDNVTTSFNGNSTSDDEVFLDNGERKYVGDSGIDRYMVETATAGDPKTTEFIKRLWGYEDVAAGAAAQRQQSLASSTKFPSQIMIDHNPTNGCGPST